jgi:hypothetical protein
VQFAYGDKEGKAREARLQHPLGVCWVAGGLNRVVTTDTYNHKVKLLDPATNVISFWLGNGKPGLSDGERPHGIRDTYITHNTTLDTTRMAHETMPNEDSVVQVLVPKHSSTNPRERA